MSIITFGMIIKNGMPWIKYSIKCVYNYAYQIIIIDGGSTDGTITHINNLINFGYDKIKLIQGIYNNKTDQCNEYLKYTNSDFIIQLDCDEIYHKQSLDYISKFLDTAEGNVYCIPILNFFRTLNNVVIGDMWSTPPVRIFRFKPGCKYLSHRPPTMYLPGIGNIKSNGESLKPYDAMIYHYSHVGIEQVKRKAKYYSVNMKDHPIYSKYIEWFSNVYMNKDIKTNLHITGGNSKLLNFKGKHPEVIEEAIKNGELNSFLNF